MTEIKEDYVNLTSNYQLVYRRLNIIDNDYIVFRKCINDITLWLAIIIEHTIAHECDI